MIWTLHITIIRAELPGCGLDWLTVGSLKTNLGLRGGFVHVFVVFVSQAYGAQQSGGEPAQRPRGREGYVGIFIEAPRRRPLTIARVIWLPAEHFSRGDRSRDANVTASPMALPINID
ncbi:unnamed protein product, partial [Iphiclides podalirius]